MTALSLQAVRLSFADRAEIVRHAESTYPEECCGYLVGRPVDSPERVVDRVLPARNQARTVRRRRFRIDSGELRSTEAALERAGEAVVGFYHSHPDHPAQPSGHDRNDAWPWYAYLVQSVQEGRATELAAFELDPETLAFGSIPILHSRPIRGAAVPNLPAAKEA